LINYRKRVDRDAAEVHLQAAARAAARWFPILDDMERALRETTTEGVDHWKAGLELIYRKALSALEAEGIISLEEKTGSVFDPNRHEAVTMEPCPDREDGEILEVVRRGYRQGDRVLRPAQVRVACKPASDEPAAGEG
jgi:molecular chaperone GrpE